MPRDLQRFWKFCFATVVSRGNEKKGFWFIMGGRGFIVGFGATVAVKIRWFIDMAVGRRVKSKTGAAPKPRRTPCVSTAGNRLKSGAAMAGIDFR